jgi:hypothetical protein
MLRRVHGEVSYSDESASLAISLTCSLAWRMRLSFGTPDGMALSRSFNGSNEKLWAAAGAVLKHAIAAAMAICDFMYSLSMPAEWAAALRDGCHRRLPNVTADRRAVELTFGLGVPRMDHSREWIGL